jgi:3-oxoacyl-[acyl-carrier-protein] synthase II
VYSPADVLNVKTFARNQPRFAEHAQSQSSRMSNSSRRRVVITGFGLISPLGNTPESFWDGLISSRSAVAPLQSLPATHLSFNAAAEARDFTGHIDDYGPLEKMQKRSIRKGIKVMSREIQLGVAAAQRALTSAGLAPGDYDVERTGVVYGSDYILTMPEEFNDGIRSSMQDGEFQYDLWAENGLPKVTPLWLLKYLPNMPASHIAIYNDLRGPSNSITMREASSNLAIGEAARLIERGSADIMVAGATGTRVHPLRTLHVAMQEELAPHGDNPARLSRPFDLDRVGMVLGEGAGALILEDLPTAQARGATILAEILDYGSSTVMAKSGVGNLRHAVRNVLQQALRGSGLDRNAIGHVHAHGVATRRGDAEEAAGIHDAFQDRQRPVPVTTVKSHIGNPGAACGVLEAIASLMAMQHEQLFPVMNYETPDPACPVDVVHSTGIPAGNNFISVNVTPQGQSSSVVISKFAE